MKKLAPKIARYVLGLTFFVFGGAGLFNLFPAPPDMPAALLAFTNAITATGYFIPVLKLTETICGLLLPAGWSCTDKFEAIVDVSIVKIKY